MIALISLENTEQLQGIRDDPAERANRGLAPKGMVLAYMHVSSDLSEQCDRYGEPHDQRRIVNVCKYRSF